MKGFLNNRINEAIREDAYKRINDYIISSCETMVTNKKKKEVKIQNDENIIRNVLLNETLDNDYYREKNEMLQFRFEPECQEGYNSESATYEGRTDIKILLQPDSFKKRQAYYTVECKRINGTKDLNEKYIDKGVYRFITEKYPSYYGKNFMLGFVVKHINIRTNANTIELYQNNKEDSRLHGKFQLIKSSHLLCEYECNYDLDRKQLLLNHIFFNFSEIVE